MPSLRQLASYDATKTKVLKLDGLDGAEVEVTYYPNRITMGSLDANEFTLSEDGLDDEDRAQADAHSQRLCKLIKEWDLDGPVHDIHGRELLGDGVRIPLDPDIVRWIPMTVLSPLNVALNEAEFQTGKRRKTPSRR